MSFLSHYKNIYHNVSKYSMSKYKTYHGKRSDSNSKEFRYIDRFLQELGKTEFENPPSIY
jgi:hypothetical protein